MASAAKLMIEIGADTKEAENAFSKVGKSLENISQTALGVFGGQMMTQAVNGLANVGKAALDAYANYERLSASLETLTARELKNSGAATSMADALSKAGPKAKELLDWIQKLAVESPFTSEGVSAAFRTAQAYGFTADEAKRLTSAMIDFAAGSGATEGTMNQIALALGQIQAKGKIAGQEVLQLVSAGVAVDAILAKAFGKSTAEIVAMREAGLIPAKAAIDAITKSLEEDFGGAAKRQSQTFAGLISSLQDIKSIGLREFFEGTFKAIQPYLTDFVNTLSSPAFMAGLAGIGDKLGSALKGLLENFNTAEMRSKLDELGKSFGELGDRILQGIADPKTAEGLVNLAGSLVNVAKGAADAALAFGDLAPATQNAVLALGGLVLLGGPLKTAIEGIVGVKTAFMALGSIGAAANPIVLGIAAIAAAGTGLVLAFGEMENKAKQYWEKTNSGLSDWLDGMVAGGATVNEIVDGMGDAWRGAVDNALPAINSMKGGYSELVDLINGGRLEFKPIQELGIAMAETSRTFEKFESNMNRLGITNKQMILDMWGLRDASKGFSDEMNRLKQSSERVQLSKVGTDANVAGDGLQTAAAGALALKTGMDKAAISIPEVTEGFVDLKGAVEAFQGMPSYADQIKADAKAAEEGGKAIAKAYEDSMKAAQQAQIVIAKSAAGYWELAQAMKGISIADLAKISMDNLNGALEAGAISPVTYDLALQTLLADLGLIDDKSQLLAVRILDFNSALESGAIPVQNYAIALRYLRDHIGDVDFSWEGFLRKFQVTATATLSLKAEDADEKFKEGLKNLDKWGESKAQAKLDADDSTFKTKYDTVSSDLVWIGLQTAKAAIDADTKYYDEKIVYVKDDLKALGETVTTVTINADTTGAQKAFDAFVLDVEGRYVEVHFDGGNGGGGGGGGGNGGSGGSGENVNPGGYEQYAMGGTVYRGTPSLVGEKGMELFIPRVTGTILTNEELDTIINQLFVGGHFRERGIGMGSAVTPETSEALQRVTLGGSLVSGSGAQAFKTFGRDPKLVKENSRYGYVPYSEPGWDTGGQGPIQTMPYPGEMGGLGPIQTMPAINITYNGAATPQAIQEMATQVAMEIQRRSR